MNGLFLPGYGCKPWIWQNVKASFNDCDLIIVEWPTHLTNHFHEIADFSKWIIDTYKIESLDFMIGHSMGGLIALHLSTLNNIKIKDVVLVESFIMSPGKFFQNLLMDSTDDIIKKNVMDMLTKESKYFSRELGNQLKNSNFTDLIETTKSRIHCVYGDRGNHDHKIVIDELGMPNSISNNINIKMIPNSCHFPMLENSEQFIEVLHNRIL